MADFGFLELLRKALEAKKIGYVPVKVLENSHQRIDNAQRVDWVYCNSTHPMGWEYPKIIKDDVS